MIVSPETVVRWHRSGFALYWRAISRGHRIVGRRRISKEVRDLIFRMMAEAPSLRPSCLIIGPAHRRTDLISHQACATIQPSAQTPPTFRVHVLLSSSSALRLVPVGRTIFHSDEALARHKGWIGKSSDPQEMFSPAFAGLYREFTGAAESWSGSHQ
jgi:hypothetical protein